MKIILNAFTFFLLGQTLVVAQEESKISDYNKWSLELNMGQNKPNKPFAEGYYSSDPNTYFNFVGVSHVDFGARYMFNTSFGAKLDFGYDIMQNQSGTASLTFETKQYRLGLQGVINASRLLKFETFSNRLGLLVHGGLQVSQLAPQTGVNKDIIEKNGGLIIGLTPQLKLSNRLVVTGDFSFLSNLRQHLNWDGSSALASNNLSGSLFTSSLGLTLYLGKQIKHADWFTNEEAVKKLTAIDNEARNRLSEIETMLIDTDKDGVPDYLDRENNTPGGVSVDTRGRFIDQNNNGAPDEMESSKGKTTTSMKIKAAESIEANLVENGLVNIFFDLNSAVPNTSSSNDLLIILRYLKNNPTSTIQLFGFTDTKGDEALNKELSLKRANYVAGFLISNGILKHRIAFDGLGVDQNFSIENKISATLSRRVSLTITKNNNN